MISLPSGTHIWIAAGVTDLRRGFTGLSAVAQTVLEKEPHSGHVFVFRGPRGDLIKLLWWDGDGLCLKKHHTADFRMSQRFRRYPSRLATVTPSTRKNERNREARRAVFTALRVRFDSPRTESLSLRDC
jgi:transposase